MKLLFLLLFSIHSQGLAKKWIDPHDMNTNSKRHLKKSFSTGEVYQEQETCICDKTTEPHEANSIVYLKRVLNLLINAADVDKSDTTMYRGKLAFNIGKEDFTFLSDFSSSKNVDLVLLRKLDTVLSDAFHKSYIDEYFGHFLLSQENLWFFIFSSNSLKVLGIGVALYVMYTLLKSNFSMWYVLRYFMFVILIIDYGLRYEQLYEEAEKHNMNIEYSSKCDTSKMGWADYFMFSISQQNCEKKVVTPLEVGLLQVKNIIIIPLSAAGTGMGQFGKELWQNLPFPWNILIFPIMLLFCAILIAIIMTTARDAPLKIKLLHLFDFQFGGKRQDSQSGISEGMLGSILNALHRPQVEDVKKKKETKYQPIKNKKSKKEDEGKMSPKRKDELNDSGGKDRCSPTTNTHKSSSETKLDHPSDQSCSKKAVDKDATTQTSSSETKLDHPSHQSCSKKAVDKAATTQTSSSETKLDHPSDQSCSKKAVDKDATTQTSYNSVGKEDLGATIKI